VILAGPLAGQVVRDSTGTTEFIGLRRWSLPRLLDTLRALAPGQPIHQCAVTLKTQLGFPEAAVTSYQFGATPVTIVSVVEPQDRARIVYRRPKQRLKVPQAWSPLVAVARSARWWQLDIALISWPFVRAGQLDSADAIVQKMRQDSTAIRGIWGQLRLGWKVTALRHLRFDRDSIHRRVAVALLAHYPDDPAVWRALAEALRDADEPVHVLARRLLHTFAIHWPRPVDWQPIVPSLRASLAGTRLFGFTTLIQVLNASEVSPRLAGPLLGRGNGDLILAFASAEVFPEQRGVQQLLSRLSGLPPGSDREVWKAWLARLD
jgi:hypothetical protein